MPPVTGTVTTCACTTAISPTTTVLRAVTTMATGAPAAVTTTGCRHALQLIITTAAWETFTEIITGRATRGTGRTGTSLPPITSSPPITSRIPA